MSTTQDSINKHNDTMFKQIFRPVTNSANPDYDMKKDESKRAEIDAEANSYWYDPASLCEGMGEATFNNDLIQLLIIAKGMHENPVHDISNIEFAAVSAEAMILLLSSISDYFQKIAEMKS